MQRMPLPPLRLHARSSVLRRRVFVVWAHCSMLLCNLSDTLDVLIKIKKQTNQNKKPLIYLSGFLIGIGRSDRIRTCGILVPNQARYQLRYTPIFSFAVIFRPRLSHEWRGSLLLIILYLVFAVNVIKLKHKFSI